VEFEYSGRIPDLVYGYASVNSQGGHSAFSPSTEQWPTSTEAFVAREEDHQQARRTLESMGFMVLAESPLGIAVAGAPGAFEELTAGNIIRREVLMYAESGHQRYVTHIDIAGNGQPDVIGLGVAATPNARIEGVVLERPRLYNAVFPSPIPPLTQRFHLRVPDDVALGTGATEAHRQGHVGKGVMVAMVDSGHYLHPFFPAHRYDVRPPIALVPSTDPSKDPVGHGTGESANIFAVAPGATVQPLRASNNSGDLVAAIGGFLRAKALKPAIMTNSWGGDGPYPPSGPPDAYDRAWALEIRHAVEQGILVIFSAGNGQFSIEPQVPGVLAAGGTFMQRDLTLSASDYASGYDSPWFRGERVPDVCGLVGMRPRAQYLMLPIPSGCKIDVDESQPALPQDPNSDGTAPNDGWALFSGTSAAAPQLAGVAALILGAKPGLTPAQVTEAMVATAVDITTGHCHPRFNFPAAVGPDLATGAGLVNASAAVGYAIRKS
jgi:subtilisin family serine protease